MSVDHHGHGHAHGNGHDHDHGDVFHTHAPIGKMKLAFFLTLLILAFEVVGGVLSHSLALMSDAGHVLTDIAAIGLAWYALNQAQKPPNESMTFGYHRAGILAALINGLTLIVIALVIAFEAYDRFLHPEPVGSLWMFISAGVGLGVNLFLGFGLSREENINVRSALLHIMGDAAASAGVIVGGIIISLTGWYAIDPLLSVLIAVLIAFGAWRIVKQTVAILMEGTPNGLDLQHVVDAILAIDGVEAVHDLHAWSITSGKNALSCHVVLDGDMTIRESQTLLREIEHRLEHMGIGHVTIQAEDAEHPHRSSLWCADEHEHHHHDHEDHHNHEDHHDHDHDEEHDHHDDHGHHHHHDHHHPHSH